MGSHIMLYTGLFCQCVVKSQKWKEEATAENQKGEDGSLIQG